MKKALLILLSLTMFLLTSCKLMEENTLMFVNSNNTSFLYSLLDDNINPKIEFDGLAKKPLDNGYMYYSLDGRQKYYFLNLEGYDNPVLSYCSFNNIDNEEGVFFGIKLGDYTTISKNSTLGIKKTTSLTDYLLNNGFERSYKKEYANSGYQSVNNRYVAWQTFIKDNVFINIALENNQTKNFAAIEMGIITKEVENELSRHKEGFNISFTNQEHFYKLNNENVLQTNKLVHLRLMKLPEEGIPKLFINDQYVKDFIPVDDMQYFYEVFFFMPNYDINIDVKVN